MKNHKFYMLCIEGVDGTGKNTLSKAIVSRLREILGESAVKFMTAPDYDGVYGKAIKSILTSVDYDAVNDPYSVQTISTLFSMDRISRIRPLVLNPEFLEETTILVCDRWFYSNFMYQCSKLARDRAAIRNWVKYNFRREFIDSGLCAAISDIYSIVLEVDRDKNEKMITTRNDLDHYETNRNYLEQCSAFVKNFDRTILDDESCPEVIRKFYYDNVKILPITPVKKDENFEAGIRANAEYIIRNVPFLKAIIDPPNLKNDSESESKRDNTHIQFFKFTYSLEKLYKACGENGNAAIERFANEFLSKTMKNRIESCLFRLYNCYHGIRWSSKDKPKFEFVMFCYFDPMRGDAVAKTLRKYMRCIATMLEDFIGATYTLLYNAKFEIRNNLSPSEFHQLLPKCMLFDDIIVFRIPETALYIEQFDLFLDKIFNILGATYTSTISPIRYYFYDNNVERRTIIYHTFRGSSNHNTLSVSMLETLFNEHFGLH